MKVRNTNINMVQMIRHKYHSPRFDKRSARGPSRLSSSPYMCVAPTKYERKLPMTFRNLLLPLSLVSNLKVFELWCP
jgi:hypothetical protein